MLIIYFFHIKYSSMYNLSQQPNQQATLRLQHAIYEFKRKQNDKSVLENKLHILKQKCQINRRKTKVVKTQVNKINAIKSSFQLQKNQIKQVLLNSAEKHAQKIIKEKTLREQSKQNMHVIRNLIQKEKSYQYNKIKERTKINQMRITQNMKQSLHQKRQKSLEVKLQEESSRLNQTIYLEKKRLLAQSKSEIELQPIKLGTDRTNSYLRQMKLLEKQMTEKLRSSRQSLSNSKISLQKTMR